MSSVYDSLESLMMHSRHSRDCSTNNIWRWPAEAWHALCQVAPGFVLLEFCSLPHHGPRWRFGGTAIQPRFVDFRERIEINWSACFFVAQSDLQRGESRESQIHTVPHWYSVKSDRFDRCIMRWIKQVQAKQQVGQRPNWKHRRKHRSRQRNIFQLVKRVAAR